MPLKRTRVLFRFFYERALHPILRINDSPQAIAGGVALGILVGFTPTVGIQMIIAVFLGTLLRVNRIAAGAMVWISNPLTFVPMYYCDYRLGTLFLGRKVLTYGQFKSLLPAHANGILDGLARMLNIGLEIAVPLWIGSIICGLIFSIPSYFFILYLVKRYQEIKIGVVRGEEG